VSWAVARWVSVAGLEQSFGGRRDATPAGVATLRQVHGRRLYDVTDSRSAETEGDGLATVQRGSLVGVWTADCVPVHLVAPRARVAAAVHCGWRGTGAGVIPEALELFERRYAVSSSEVEAALGPAIGGCCYEVGGEVREAFRSRAGQPLGDVGFTTRGGRLFLDLRIFLAAELAGLGVAQVETVGPCTACHTDLLFSYRKEGSTGRQLSWIGWR
jgi:YfiH family protein